ncbi:uncharacterized protein LOC119722295 [Patiria miniata]|uniref:PPPDE domain-containing protein n=1 Tax=Patiria miniata TaxID=46514 RepID=A0A913ZBK6_PATMI|nr:uncharacterized protein LOC119722295 [Patiria miniata]
MEQTHAVKLYVYDLTKGLAAQMSMPLLGKHLDGVWHTSVVVFGREYFYGGGGIESCKPSGTILGQPNQVHEMGTTQVDYTIWLEYMGGLGCDEFSGERYNLFEHNCNTFSNEACQFLTGNSIPTFILNLPHEVMNTPIGAMMKGLIESLSSNPTGRVGGPTHRPIYDPVPLPNYPDPPPAKPSEVKPASESAAKPEQAQKSEPQASTSDAQATASSEAAATNKGADSGHAQSSGATADVGSPVKDSSRVNLYYDSDDEYIDSLRQSAPPEPLRLKVFSGVDVTACVETIKKEMPEGVLTREEMELLMELKDCLRLEFLLEEPPSPVKSETFLVIGKLLNLAIGGIPSEVLHPLVDLLSMAFLSQDVIHTLCNNEDQTVMTFVSSSDCHPLQIQISVFRMLCNICTAYSGKHWLTQVRHWTLEDGSPQCNRDIVSRLVVSAILSGSDELCCAASALVYNLTRYTVSDDNAVEFSSALLQSLTSEAISEETAYYSLLALYGLMKCGEVMCLATVMGLDTARYAKISDRLGKLCADIDSVIG